MHIPTHILSGWVGGNAFPLRPGERLACMIAATIPDFDGVGIILGENAYQRWHHMACHNLPFCILASGILAAIGQKSAARRAAMFVLYAGLFHLHLLMDYFGSGPGWPIVYLWPLSNFRFVNWQAWELSSWQNTVAAGVLLAITVAIAIVRKRTPLEVLMPSLDAKLVDRSL